MTPRHPLFTALLAMAPLAFAAPASAVDLHACTHDAAKLCPHVRPGEGRVAKCLKDHEDKIGKACAKVLDDLKG